MVAAQDRVDLTQIRRRESGWSEGRAPCLLRKRPDPIRAAAATPCPGNVGADGTPAEPLPLRSRAGCSNVRGADSSFMWEGGQTTANARPMTSLTGIVPPPGSPRWARESAETER